MKLFTSTVAAAAAFAIAAASVAPALAHVTVSPSEAAVGERVNFIVSAPNEKDIAFNEIRLAIPEQLESVTPTVASGWDIDTTTEGDRITSVTWSGGSVPEGQRVEFSVRAQIPEGIEKLEWKAYQTYADGTEVAWDQAAEASSDHGSSSGEEKEAGPFSETRVTPAQSNDADNDSQSDTETIDATSQVAPLAISIVALALAVYALVRGSKR